MEYIPFKDYLNGFPFAVFFPSVQLALIIAVVCAWLLYMYVLRLVNVGTLW